MIIAKFFENVLHEELTEKQFADVLQRCFRLVQVVTYLTMEESDFKDFMCGMIKPTDDEINFAKENGYVDLALHTMKGE
jgi:hypothetical protein